MEKIIEKVKQVLQKWLDGHIGWTCEVREVRVYGQNGRTNDSRMREWRYSIITPAGSRLSMKFMATNEAIRERKKEVREIMLSQVETLLRAGDELVSKHPESLRVE